MYIYITFGFDHRHIVNGISFDNNSIAKIEAEDFSKGREKAFELFGAKFATSYLEDQVTEKFVQLFPRGVIEIEHKELTVSDTDCYKCIHRGSVPGSVHTMCRKPDPNMTGHAHGRQNGWFNYPHNFDPTWKSRYCNTFESKSN